MRRIFWIFVVILFFAGSSAFGQWGYSPWGWSGYRGFTIPGYEAQTLVLRNQALVYGIAGQQYPVAPQLYQPQIQQIQYQVVPRPKSGNRVLLEAGLGAAAGGSLGMLIGGGKNDFIFGAGLGGAAGAMNALQEYDYSLVPVVVQPAQPPQQPSAQQVSQPGIEVVPRLAGVEFRVSNETKATIIVEIPDGRRAVVGPGAMARTRTPDIRVFIVKPDDKGSFQEVEINLQGTQDLSLPGWRIQ